MTKLQRILVTGGAGFIGSHTVDLLLRQNMQVIVLDNLSSGRLENLNLQHPHLEFVEGDVLEYPLVVDLLKSCDAVLHLAAISSVPLSIEDPIYSFQVNTQGFLHILVATLKARRAIRLVYASSAAVYGDQSELPCREDAWLTHCPRSPYAMQKMHNEEYADLYAHLYGIKSLALRYFNVYGLRQDPLSPYSGVITRFLDDYEKDLTLTIFGDGLQSRDFIHVKDVAMANWLALQSHYTGVLNIATGQAKTLLNLLEYLEAFGKKSVKSRFEAKRAGDIFSSYASTKLAEEHLGFSYSINLKEGLEELLHSTR